VRVRLQHIAHGVRVPAAGPVEHGQIPMSRDLPMPPNAVNYLGMIC
jgi:hypothetical protein